MYNRELYIARTWNSGEFRDSGPCIDCLSVIKSLNLKKIVYSCSDISLVVCKPRDYIPVHHTFGRKHINTIGNNRYGNAGGQVKEKVN